MRTTEISRRPPAIRQRALAARSIALGALLGVIWSQQAHAYVDPNVAGWLFQLLFPLFAAVLGVWAFVRNRVSGAWRRVTALFQSNGARDDDSSS